MKATSNYTYSIERIKLINMHKVSIYTIYDKNVTYYLTGKDNILAHAFVRGGEIFRFFQIAKEKAGKILHRISPFSPKFFFAQDEFRRFHFRRNEFFTENHLK
jgi:hypothetical protein